MNAHLPQLGAALVATATPWIVVQIAHVVARRHVHALGDSVPTSRRTMLLGRATVAAAFPVVIFAVLLPAPSAMMGVIDLVVFGGLSVIGLLALGDLDTATWSARHVDIATRAASLAPRRHHHFLPWFWRILLFGATTAGLAAFAWRITTSSPGDRRLFMPIAFALVAIVFLYLYEAWIHALVKGPVVSDSTDATHTRRRLIHMVFATESVLVISFLAGAHVLLTLDWTVHASGAAMVGVAGSVLGVIGCALALSSDLITRQYRVIR
jgi:hypothetical protein